MDPKHEPKVEALAVSRRGDDGRGARAADRRPRRTPVTREQRRSRRKRAIRAKTISVKRMTKRELELGRLLYPDVEDVERPRTRAECADGAAPVPVRLVQAPPLPRRLGADGRHQAQLPGPRGLGDDRDLRARRRRPRRDDARGGRRDHEPDARAHPPGRGEGPRQARGAARHDGPARLRGRGAGRQAPPAGARAADDDESDEGEATRPTTSRHEGPPKARRSSTSRRSPRASSTDRRREAGAAARIDRGGRSRYPRAHAHPHGAPLRLRQVRPRPLRARAARARRDASSRAAGRRRRSRPRASPSRRSRATPGSPEVMDGRVKTLHPRVHGGILSRGERDEGDLERLGGARDRPRRRQPLPVRARRGRPGVEPRAHRREHRHRRPVDGPLGGEEPRARHRRVRSRATTAASSTRSRSGGDTTPETRAELAAKAFAHTAAYDAAISGYLSSRDGRRQPRAASRGTSRCPSSARTACATARTRTRRAPSTSSATRRPGSLARAESLGAGGKELSLQQPRRRRRGARRRARVRPPGRGRREAHQPVRRRGRGDARRRLSRGARGRPAERLRRDRRAEPRGGRGDGEGPRRDVPRVRRRAVVRAARRSRCCARRRTCACSRRSGWLGPEHAALTSKRVGGGLVVQDRDATAAGEVTRGKVATQARPHGRRAEEPRVRLARLQARQVERHRARARRDDGGRRRRPDVSRGFGADRMREGGREGARKRARVATRSSRSPTASRRRRRRGSRRSRSPGGSVKDADVIAAADAPRPAMVLTGRAPLPALTQAHRGVAAFVGPSLARSWHLRRTMAAMTEGCSVCAKRFDVQFRYQMEERDGGFAFFCSHECHGRP